MSKSNLDVFLIELHEIIKKNSEISECLTNPLDTYLWEEYQLSENEIKELTKTNFNNESLSAIEKIVRNKIMNAFFESLAILDGVGDPSVVEAKDVWLGLKLQEKTLNDEDADFLHDQLYEKYWEWLALKSSK